MKIHKNLRVRVLDKAEATSCLVSNRYLESATNDSCLSCRAIEDFPMSSTILLVNIVLRDQGICGNCRRVKVGDRWETYERDIYTSVTSPFKTINRFSLLGNRVRVILSPVPVICTFSASPPASYVPSSPAQCGIKPTIGGLSSVPMN